MDPGTRAVYEARASDWARLRPARSPERAAALGARSLRGHLVADLGCGPGSYFAALDRPVVGLDGALAMLRLARQNAPQAVVVQADLSALPFRRGSIGGGWARASYVHLPRASLPVALAHLHAAMAPGAPVEMSLRAGSGEGPVPDDDFAGRFFSHWQANDLSDVMTGAGFDLETIEEGDGWLIVRAIRARTLPDVVGPNMGVLVCGLNPSVVSADAGFGYARATNRFWVAALDSGLIGPASRHRPLHALAAQGVGMTDLVKRATTGAGELRGDEYRAGAERVARLVAWLRPRLTLFVGLDGWRAAVDRAATPGLQPRAFGGVPAYVMPSTSGRNARSRREELVAHMIAARRLSRRQSSRRHG